MPLEEDVGVRAKACACPLSFLGLPPPALKSTGQFPSADQVVGILTVHWLAMASNKLSHSDFLIQLALTITMAYLSFFIGEMKTKGGGIGGMGSSR